MSGDKLLDLAVGVEVTSNGQVIGETLDLGAGYNTGGYDAVYYCEVIEPITGTGINITGSDTEAFATSKVLISKELTAADKAAGARFILGSLPKTGNCRFIRAVSDGITAGKVNKIGRAHV